MHWSRYLLLAVTTVLALTFAGCSTVRMTYGVSEPPRLKPLRERTQVFVATFNGRGGHGLTNDLSIRIDRANYHRRVHDEELATIVVRGAVQPLDHQDYAREDERKECAKRNKKNKCTEWRNVTYYIRKESCTLIAQVEIVNRKTGQTLSTETYRGYGGNEAESTTRLPPSTQNALCQKATDEVLSQIAGELVPQRRDRQIAVKRIYDKESATSDAIYMMEMGKGDTAKLLALFEKAAQDPTLDPDDKHLAQYNLALGRYLTGDYTGCLEALKKTGPLVEEWEVRELHKRCVKFK